MSKAKAVVTKIDSRTSRLSLKAGEKGTGKTLWSGQFWPDSPRSVDAIYDMMATEADRLDVEVVWDKDGDE